jgi:AcrR family transcriptional regulator
MYKLCKTEQSAARQREIEESFLSLMETKDYEAITVSELCVKTNTPRKAFYRYFDTKEDIVLALIDHTLACYESFASGASRPAKRTVASELESFFSFWCAGEPRRVLVAIMKHGLEGYLIQRSIRFSSTEMPSLKKFMSSEAANESARLFQFVITGLMSVMLSWFKEGCAESAREMARVVQRLVAEPLFPNLEEYGILKE